jgi:hypothetical protein
LLGRDKQPLPRNFACPPPCQTAKGCPKGTPDNQVTLLPENQRAYEHYWECRAVNQFPDDPTVKRNAAIILKVENEHARWSEEQFRRRMIEAVGRTVK